MGLLMDFIRWVVWTIATVGLWCCDAMFDVIVDIAKINVWDLSYNGVKIIDTLWNLFMIFLIIAVAIRLVYYIVGTFYNGDNKVVGDGLLKKFIMIFVVIIVMNAVPVFMPAMSEFNERYFELFKTSQTHPSTIIVTAGAKVNTSFWVDNEYITDEGSVVTLDEIAKNGINATKDDSVIDNFFQNFTGGRDYKYFNDTAQLFITLIMSLWAGFVFCLIALDVGKRLFELVLLIVIAFIPVSDLVDDGKTFSQWLKMIVSIFLSNIVEVTFVLVVMMVVMGMNKSGVIIQLVVLIGGLFFCLNGSQKLAQLLGIETSGSTLQDLANLSLISRTVTAPFRGAMALGSKAIDTVSSKATSYAGDKLGGVGDDYGYANRSYSAEGEYDGKYADPLMERAMSGVSGNSYISSDINSGSFNTNDINSDSFAKAYNDVNDANYVKDSINTNDNVSLNKTDNVNETPHLGEIKEDIPTFSEQSQAQAQSQNQFEIGNNDTSLRSAGDISFGTNPFSNETLLKEEGLSISKNESTINSDVQTKGTEGLNQANKIRENYSYSRPVVWQRGSKGERLSNWANTNDGTQRVRKYAMRQLDRSYEKQLQKKLNKKRGYK